MKNKSYKFRIYPNTKQEILINKTFGMVRKYWNECVASFNSYDYWYNPKPRYDTAKEFREKYPWAKELSATPLQQKFGDFLGTQKQFFNKKRKVPVGRMKFKSKNDSRASYRVTNDRFKIKGDAVRIQKIGWVKCVFDREVEGRILSATISKNSSNQYFVSIVTEQEIRHKPKTNKSIALDMGILHFCTDNKGNKLANPKFLNQNLDELTKLQRFLSKKTKGSRRFKKCKLKIARLHQKIKNQREHFLDNLSTSLVNNFDKIAVEDLNVQKMLEKGKTNRLSKHISDVSWSKFFEMLNYKCDWYGKELIKVNPMNTSKICSRCGKIKDMPLSQRVYECSCGLNLDRDHNAAKNILKLACS